MRSPLFLCLCLAAACGSTGSTGAPPADAPDGSAPPSGAPDAGAVGPAVTSDSGSVLPGSDAAAGSDAQSGADAAVGSAVLQISASANDAVPKAPNALVMAQALAGDSGGTTSLRFALNKVVDANMYPVGAPNNNHIAPPTERMVQERDRDLGQTFLTGDHGFALDAVYLRVGPSDQAVLAGANGAEVALEFFEVTGEPTLNDSGTAGFLKDGSGVPVFDRSKSPQLDDYLESETYTPILVARGTLPQAIAANDYLTFKLMSAAPFSLKSHTAYAFVLMFTERAQDRAMGLANAYWGAYQPDTTNTLTGHGIRREGGSGMAQSPFFRPDLPDDSQARLAQQPGTLGFPDVDTWRDLYFTVTAAQGSVTN